MNVTVVPIVKLDDNEAFLAIMASHSARVKEGDLAAPESTDTAPSCKLCHRHWSQLRYLREITVVWANLSNQGSCWIIPATDNLFVSDCLSLRE